MRPYVVSAWHVEGVHSPSPWKGHSDLPCVPGPQGPAGMQVGLKVEGQEPLGGSDTRWHVDTGSVTPGHPLVWVPASASFPHFHCAGRSCRQATPTLAGGCFPDWGPSSPALPPGPHLPRRTLSRWTRGPPLRGHTTSFWGLYTEGGCDLPPRCWQCHTGVSTPRLPPHPARSRPAATLSRLHSGSSSFSRPHAPRPAGSPPAISSSYFLCVSQSAIAALFKGKN